MGDPKHTSRHPRKRGGKAEVAGKKMLVHADVGSGTMGVLEDLTIGANPDAATRVFSSRAAAAREVGKTRLVPKPELPHLIPELPGAPVHGGAAEASTERSAAMPAIEVHDEVGAQFSAQSVETMAEHQFAQDHTATFLQELATEPTPPTISAADHVTDRGDAVVTDAEFAVDLAEVESAPESVLQASTNDTPNEPTARPVPPEEISTSRTGPVAAPVPPPLPVPPAVPSPISRPVPPPQYGRRMDTSVDTAPHASAEQATKKGLDAVAAATERRGGGRLKRFMAFAVPIGAAVVAAVLAWGHFEPKPAHDQEPTPDAAGQTGNDAFADASQGSETAQTKTEAAPTPDSTAGSVDMVIGGGEGSSQALAHMGLDQAHIQHALDLPVQIGDTTVTVRDTYVTAKPGELTLIADWNGDQVTGVHYSAGGHQLSAQELSNYLIVSHPQPNEQAPKVASAGHPDSGAGFDFSADDARVQAALDSLPSFPLEVHQPDMPHNAAAPAPLVDATVSMPTVSPDYGVVSFDSAKAPVEIHRPDFPASAETSQDTATELMPDRPADVRLQEVPTEKVEVRVSDYPTQLRALDALLKGEKDRTLEMASNHLEFRKRGEHYEVRYLGSKTFDELTPELLANLARVARLDFEHPLGVMALTPEEYASALPDGDPYKERIRQGLQTQVEMSKEVGMHNLVAERGLRILNGEPTPSTDSAVQ